MLSSIEPDIVALPRSPAEAPGWRGCNLHASPWMPAAHIAAPAAAAPEVGSAADLRRGLHPDCRGPHPPAVSSAPDPAAGDPHGAVRDCALCAGSAASATAPADPAASRRSGCSRCSPGWCSPCPARLSSGTSFTLVFDNFIKTVLMCLVIAASVRSVRDVRRLAFAYFSEP